MNDPFIYQLGAIRMTFNLLAMLDENNLANALFAVLLVAMFVHWGSANNPSRSIHDWGRRRLMWGVAAGTAVVLLLRWIHAGHFPLSNLYESFMFLSLCVIILQLDLERRLNNPTVGDVICVIPLILHGIASLRLPLDMQEAAPLVPALRSNWLMMHVTVMIASYAMLICGSVLAIVYLVVTRGRDINLDQTDVAKSESFLRQDEDEVLITDLRGTSMDMEAPRDTYDSVYPEINLAWLPWKMRSLPASTATPAEEGIRDSGNGGGPRQLPNTNTLAIQESNALPHLGEATMRFARDLDMLIFRPISLGFPLLTLGIISGAVWANEAWGSYWSWDPKETWALITWLVFAMYMHARITYGMRGRMPAVLAAIGFVVVWICYLGVNLMGQGLHSYGWLQ